MKNSKRNDNKKSMTGGCVHVCVRQKDKMIKHQTDSV